MEGLKAGQVAPDKQRGKRAKTAKELEKHPMWLVATVVAGFVLLLMCLVWCMFKRNRNARLVLKEH